VKNNFGLLHKTPIWIRILNGSPGKTKKMSDNKTIQLELTIDEINLILEALGNEPFIKVHQLIAKIQQQASKQLQADNLSPGNQEG
jgi:hypothetical protein